MPQASITRRDGKQGVFLATDAQSKVKFVPVQLGYEQDDRVEVLPLTPSDNLKELIDGQVVTLGKHLLEDGAAIRLPQSGNGKSKD